jgi:hypothetical protein
MHFNNCYVTVACIVNVINCITGLKVIKQDGSTSNKTLQIEHLVLVPLFVALKI